MCLSKEFKRFSKPVPATIPEFDRYKHALANLGIRSRNVLILGITEDQERAWVSDKETTETPHGDQPVPTLITAKLQVTDQDLLALVLTEVGIRLDS